MVLIMACYQQTTYKINLGKYLGLPFVSFRHNSRNRLLGVNVTRRIQIEWTCPCDQDQTEKFHSLRAYRISAFHSFSMC